MEIQKLEPPHAAVKVLVVDDEGPIRELLEKLLTREGFVVQTAPGVDDALNALQATTFDAVVLDIHMPAGSGERRSGVDVLSFMRVHEHLRRIPVIVVTGGNLTDVEEEAIWGLHGYVLKKEEGWNTVHEYLKHLTSRARADRHQD